MIVETVKYKACSIKIFTDDNPMDPREWDNLGKMACFHSGYVLGDKHDIDSKDFGGWEEIEEYLIKKEKAAVIFPLYLYDHSGLRIKIGSFRGLLAQGHAEWDTMIVGFIYATADDIRENFEIKNITKGIKDRAEKVLRSEVDTYDNYLSGDVYSYMVEDFKGEHIDSCCGFYGSEGREQIFIEAKGSVDAHAEEQQKILHNSRYREVAI